MAHSADIVAGALCDVMERALIDAGIAPDLARELARRACDSTVTSVATKAKKTKKKANKKLSAAFKEANTKLRTKSGKLRRGITQSDVARMAHKLYKKM